MNDLIGKPHVYQSNQDIENFKINYSCTDPNSLLLGDLFNAKENIEKICKRDEDEAIKEAIKFCESKKLFFSKTSLESMRQKPYYYDKYSNPCGSLCAPSEVQYTIVFKCLPN